MKLCPNCGAELTGVIGGYICHECDGEMFGEDEVICPKCPSCGNELDGLDDDYYCFSCSSGVSRDSAVYSKNASCDNDFEDEFTIDLEDNFDDDIDYDSMVNNGDAICLNCTYWSVSPHGSAYGMVCRKGYFSEGPGDSCGDFIQESHFASYGDEGQYQFNETGRAISNKLYHWKNSR